MKAIRKGAIVRYIGRDELMKQYSPYTVRKKEYNLIDIYAPTRYMNGEVHKCLVSMNIKDFEII